jgi:hypothetical protein
MAARGRALAVHHGMEFNILSFKPEELNILAAPSSLLSHRPTISMFVHRNSQPVTINEVMNRDDSFYAGRSSPNFNLQLYNQITYTIQLSKPSKFGL